jgi:4'-phosphopantetheinyl transferase
MELCTASEVNRMLPKVSSQRREQALRFKHEHGRFCCLKSWLMLEELIGEPGDFLYNENGKPYLENKPYFSISHCKEGIAVAVDNHPIGIDIEAIRHAERDLIERVMNTNERAGMDDRTFTRLWTQKEAVVKAEGVGIQSFEQLQNLLNNSEWRLKTVETEKYIYSIAYK